MPINKNELTKEMIAKAMQCRTVDELVALAKAEGFEITKDEWRWQRRKGLRLRRMKRKPISRNWPTLSWTKKRCGT